MFHSCWILPLLFTLSTCNEPLDCKGGKTPKSTSIQLKQDLLCGYDKYVRPVPYHTNRTTVGLIIAPRIINFEDHKSTLYLKTWLSMTWLDHHLIWDKLQYDGIDQVSLDTSMIWVPDLSVYNGREELSLDQVVAPAIVGYNGDVYTFISPELAGHCVPNWANWPFDIHVCTITLGSKRYLGSTVDFRFLNSQNGLFMKYLLPSKDWELLNINTTRNESELGPKNETDSLFLVSLSYKFTLRRHASVYIASYLVPGLVMVILSLGVLLIPYHQIERTAILCCLVIIQSLYLQYIAYKIPSNGDTTPYLVCFYRDCLTLTGMLVIETLLIRSMSRWNSNPSYLQSTFQLVAGNKVLQFIFTSDLDPKDTAKLMEAGNDEGSTLVSGSEGSQQWQLFANMLNKLCFILLIPIYLLLCVSLLPLNYSFSPN